MYSAIRSGRGVPTVRVPGVDEQPLSVSIPYARRMGFLDTLKGMLGSDTGDGVRYRCVECGETFDSARHECPECGSTEIKEEGGFDMRPDG